MDDFVAHLKGRVGRAMADAQRAVARSELLTSASQVAHEPDAMVTRCAWCGRLALAGRWTRIEQAPGFLAGLIARRGTHGICPDCMRRLESSGESAPLGR
jgi:hypothetical protein